MMPLTIKRRHNLLLRGGRKKAIDGRTTNSSPAEKGLWESRQRKKGGGWVRLRGKLS